MKRGKLITLWIGGILSGALLILSQAPDPIQQKLSLTLGGYVVNLLTRLAVIWIVCGLVWVTLSKRSRTEEKEPPAKSTEVDTRISSNDVIESGESTMKHPLAFLAAIVRDWIGKMSGGGGLVLTVFSFFSPPALQPQAFLVLGVLCLFYASYRAWLSEYNQREYLLQRLAPRLEFVHSPGGKPPFFEEVRGPADTRRRYLRIGLHNRGADEVPQVRLVLEACDPGDSSAVHPEHELQPMGKPQGTLTVNLAPHGTVFFDVAREEIADFGQLGGELYLWYAQPLENHLPPRGDEIYKLVLRAEGAGPARRCSIQLGGRMAWRLDGMKVLS